MFDQNLKLALQLSQQSGSASSDCITSKQSTADAAKHSDVARSEEMPIDALKQPDRSPPSGPHVREAVGVPAFDGGAFKFVLNFL